MGNSPDIACNMGFLSVTLRIAKLRYAVKVTKVLPRVLGSELPSFWYLQCSRPCPGGMSLLRSYQSIAICTVRAPAQIGCPALDVIKALLFAVFVFLPRLGDVPLTKVVLFTVFAPLLRWGVPPSKLKASLFTNY